jgi:hypothetical protein
MSSKARKKIRPFSFLDFFIIVLFLFIAVISINLFRLDLLNTINLQNVEPVGFVVIKKNIVQRRHSDRVLWDRLANESFVYIGDLIRIAEVSSATLDIEENNIDLEENTIIRIILSPDGEGVRIILSEGTLSLVTRNERKKINVEVNGRRIQSEPGTVLRATTNQNDGISVQVNQGRALFVEDGRAEREISSGSLIDMDAYGTERNERAVVVTRPAPNARYLKNTAELLSVNFLWNRINFAPNETLRLEISADRNFSQISTRTENLDRQAQTQFASGHWYWRLSFENAVLSAGSLTVLDSAGLRLLAPSANSVFRFYEELPLINFRWTEVEYASAYIFQVSSKSDFSETKIDIQTSAAFYSNSDLGEGTWYWRVIPVFPSLFYGSTNFLPAFSFHVEKSSAELSDQEISLSRWLNEQSHAFENQPAELPPAPPPPRRVQPQPVTPLPAPQNLRPARGTVFDFEGLRSQRTISFSWSAVRGANAYIFTLYQQNASGRRQVLRTTINNSTRYTLENLRVLDKGTFVWQVEPVIIGRRNAVERRGRTGESSFVMDFNSPLPVQIEDTGVLYGN